MLFMKLFEMGRYQTRFYAPSRLLSLGGKLVDNPVVEAKASENNGLLQGVSPSSRINVISEV